MRLPHDRPGIAGRTAAQKRSGLAIRSDGRQAKNFHKQQQQSPNSQAHKRQQQACGGASQLRPGSTISGCTEGGYRALCAMEALVMIEASNWRALQRNTLQGFVNLTLLPGGLVLRSCGVHKLGEKRWVSPPARPQLDRDGRPLITPKTGKPSYATIIDFADRDARDRFQAAALAAVDRLMGRAS